MLHVGTGNLNIGLIFHAELHDQNHFRSPKILHFIGVKSEINHSKMTFLEQRLKKWSFILDVI